MLRLLRPSIVLMTIGLIGLAANSQVATANGELAVGISLREEGDYPGAIEHLQRAVALDPKLVKAHFALASVADQMCNPSAEPGPDEHACKLAMLEYENVLRLDSSHLEALKGSAYLLFQFNRLNESENQYRIALARHPNDAETLCAVAAIDSRRSLRDLTETRGKLNLGANKPLTNLPQCYQGRITNEARIEEGIALLHRSYHVGGRNPDIFGYLGMLYALRADIQCGNPQQYKADKNTAKVWNRQSDQTSRESTQKVYQKCPPAPPPPPR